MRRLVSALKPGDRVVHGMFLVPVKAAAIRRARPSSDRDDVVIVDWASDFFGSSTFHVDQIVEVAP
jgi:hypothetical protein